jgi:hypothetical protein
MAHSLSQLPDEALDRMLSDAASGLAESIPVAGPADAYTTIRGLLGMLLSDDSVEAPASVRAAAKAIARPAIAQPSLVEHVRELVARLIFESRAGAAALGYRGQSAGIHLVFASEAGEVDLRIEPDPRASDGARVVTGFMDTEAPAPVRGRAVRIGQGGGTTPFECEASGHFGIRLEPGPYRLEFDLAGVRVLIPRMEVS